MKTGLIHWVRVVVMNLTIMPAMLLMTTVCILGFPFVFLSFRVRTNWNNALIMRRFVWIYGRIWQWMISPFVKMDLSEFDRRIPMPSVIVVNHLSFFDTFFMNRLPISNICFAVRAWPFKMPFYGPFMRLAKYLDVESMSWESVMARGKEVVERNGSILFFPEGHRSRDGKLKKFYSGAFKMAVETGLPLVPICITGTDRFFPPSRGWFEPCTVKMRILAPVRPETFNSHLPHCEMKRKVHALMSDNIQSMNHQDENR